MGDKSATLRFKGIYTKTEHSNDYVPQNPSEKARICLDCGNEKCTGNCKTYKEKYKQLKEKK
jgi:hypothetical protein